MSTPNPKVGLGPVAGKDHLSKPRLSSELSSSEARLDAGDVPAYYPSDVDNLVGAVSEQGYAITEAIAKLSLTVERESGDLREILSSRVVEATPHAPIGWYAMFLGHIDKGSLTTLHHWGEVVGFWPPSLYFVRDAFGNTTDVTVHGPSEDDSYAHEVWLASLYETETDLIKALQRQYVLEKKS